MNKVEYENEIQRIFQDKIYLSKILIGFELGMIKNFNDLMRAIMMGELQLDQINMDENYYSTWQQIIMLYDYFEYSDIAKQEKKKDNQKDFEDLKKLINKYKTTDRSLTFSDMKFCYDQIRKMMVVSGFHDVSLKAQDDDFETEEY